MKLTATLFIVITSNTYSIVIELLIFIQFLQSLFPHSLFASSAFSPDDVGCLFLVQVQQRKKRDPYISRTIIIIVNNILVSGNQSVSLTMKNLVSSSLKLNKLLKPLSFFILTTKIAQRNFSGPMNITAINKWTFATKSQSAGQPHENVQKSEFSGPGFHMQQLLTGCLAIYSYYIESGNEAFLIDPLNETAKYDQILQQRGKKLKGVFLTHYHADYIAGHLELKKKYNCEIYLGPKALESFGIKALKDGQQIKVGEVKLKVIHTPGHTQESSCLLLLDSNNKQQAIFTGDTLFLNEVGRPDLAVKTNLSSSDLASLLFDSLQKMKTLDENIRVYPGHGSGSACGKSIGKGDFCTLGTQKQNNYGLKQTNKDKFIKDVLHEMPSPPKYFGYNAGINKFEPFDYDNAHTNAIKKINAKDVKDKLKSGEITIIDVRSLKELNQGIIKGAITIDFDGAFANWAGTLLDHKKSYIIYGSEQNAKQSIKRLLRIGYTNIVGYFTDSISSIKDDIQVYTPDFVSTVKVENRTILDVRKPAEWAKGIVDGDVVQYELTDLFKENAKKLQKQKKYVVHCQGGYRARIAYSLLKNLGYDVKVYGEDGYKNFQKIGVKTVKPK